MNGPVTSVGCHEGIGNFFFFFSLVWKRDTWYVSMYVERRIGGGKKRKGNKITWPERRRDEFLEVRSKRIEKNPKETRISYRKPCSLLYFVLFFSVLLSLPLHFLPILKARLFYFTIYQISLFHQLFKKMELNSFFAQCEN